MISINKKFLVFIIILSFGLLIAGEVSAVSWLPLVPCGTSAQGYAFCTFCDILHLFKNVYDFLSFEITPALASVMVAVAGFYILTAGDSTTRLETGKTILKSVVISLIIIYASWLVINTALTLFAKPIGGSGGFFSFNCEAPPTPGAINISPSPGASLSPSASSTTSPSVDCIYDSPNYASACVPVSGINCQVNQDKCYMNNSANTDVISVAKNLGGIVTGALGLHSSRCGSFHSTGCALDFSGFSKTNACEFATQAGKIVGSSHIRNEYNFDCLGYPSNPSGASSGGHIHVTTCTIKPPDCQ
jgi:hypothetical protein